MRCRPVELLLNTVATWCKNLNPCENTLMTGQSWTRQGSLRVAMRRQIYVAGAGVAAGYLSGQDVAKQRFGRVSRTRLLAAQPHDGTLSILFGDGARDWLLRRTADGVSRSVRVPVGQQQ